MSKYLAIIGNGGHTQDILSILDSMYDQYSWVFLLDDRQEKNDLPVPPGKDIYDSYLKLMSKYGQELKYIIGVNSSQIRKSIAMKMDALHAVPAPPIIHSTASIGRTCQIGNGSVLGPFTVLTSNAVIGEHVHMNTASSVNQGSTLGNYCTLSPGARICGDVEVGNAVSFGANSTVINMKNIANDVVVGAGAVVVSSITEAKTVVGIPAKELVKSV